MSCRPNKVSGLFRRKNRLFSFVFWVAETEKCFSFQVGDRVFFSGASGSYAEYVACESHSVYHLPERLSFAQGAALGVPYFTAYRAIFLKYRHQKPVYSFLNGRQLIAPLSFLFFAEERPSPATESWCTGPAERWVWQPVNWPKRTVIICKIVSNAVRAASDSSGNTGMTVCGTAGSAQGMELVKKNGAHLVFNHKEKGYLDDAAKAIGGQGFDVIIENASDINLDKDLTVVAPNARIVVRCNPVNLTPFFAINCFR